tara:strand:+ start:2002 stop:3501 length:1500 start_codon:yes stop_codon:yes gene_type:complete
MSNDEITSYLNTRGYIIRKKYLEKDDLRVIKRELSVTPYTPKVSYVKPQPIILYRESQYKIYMPRFYGLENYGNPEENNIPSGKKINLKFSGKLRDTQQPVADKFIKHVKKVSSGLLELHTGFGKTIIALYILSMLKKKTLIIVHKEFLLRQWIERIEQFLPDAKVGRIQGNVIDIEDKDIVIGMLQSLSMKEYPTNQFDSFGFTILDECHHLGAEVFCKALYKIGTKYMLGLSATMKRKDGLTKVFKLFLGEVVVKKERKGEDNVLVKAIHYCSMDERFSCEERDYRDQLKYSSMIKKLCEFNPRREFILDVLKYTLNEGSEDQQIMILGHNKTLLNYLHDAIKHRKIAGGDVGYYIGGMKEEKLKESETRKVIIGTYAMAEEGLDIKSLSTLLMATSKPDVTQAVGRILRKKRKQALVVDIVDMHAVFQRHFSKRKTFYRKQKFLVKETSMYGFRNDDWKITVKKNQSVSKSNKKKFIDKNNPFHMQGKCLIDLTDI